MDDFVAEGRVDIPIVFEFFVKFVKLFFFGSGEFKQFLCGLLFWQQYIGSFCPFFKLI